MCINFIAIYTNYVSCSISFRGYTDCHMSLLTVFLNCVSYTQYYPHYFQVVIGVDVGIEVVLLLLHSIRI
jgi:hypothetical protein